MGLQGLAIIGVAGAWLASAFVLLQLVTLGRRAGVAAWIAGAAAVGVVVLQRDGTAGIGWLRSEELRSDAIALGALMAMCSATAAVVSGRSARTTWGQASCVASLLLGGVASVAAIAIGRSGWYWEFVGLIAAGVGLAAIGASGGLDRAATVDRRTTLATAGACGCVAAVGGGALLATWTAIA